MLLIEINLYLLIGLGYENNVSYFTFNNMIWYVQALIYTLLFEYPSTRNLRIRLLTVSESRLYATGNFLLLFSLSRNINKIYIGNKIFHAWANFDWEQRTPLSSSEEVSAVPRETPLTISTYTPSETYLWLCEWASCLVPLFIYLKFAHTHRNIFLLLKCVINLLFYFVVVAIP